MDSAVAAAASPRPANIFAARGAYVLGVFWIAATSYLVTLVDRPPDGLEVARLLAQSGSLGIPLVVFALAMWRNRAGLREWSALKSTGIVLWLVVQWVLWMALFFVPVGVFVLPKVLTAQSAASILILAMSSARSTVQDNARRTGSLQRSGAGAAIPTSREVHFGFAGSDGLLLAYEARRGMIGVLHPRMNAGHIEWACFGYPRRHMPSTCRAHPGDAPPTSFEQSAAGKAADHATALVGMASAMRAAPAGASRMLPPAGVMDFGYQDAGGTIALFSDRHGVLVVLEPGGRCIVFPAQAVVEGCSAGARRGGD